MHVLKETSEANNAMDSGPFTGRGRGRFIGFERGDSLGKNLETVRCSNGEVRSLALLLGPFLT